MTNTIFSARYANITFFFAECDSITVVATDREVASHIWDNAELVDFIQNTITIFFEDDYKSFSNESEFLAELPQNYAIITF